MEEGIVPALERITNELLVEKKKFINEKADFRNQVIDECIEALPEESKSNDDAEEHERGIPRGYNAALRDTRQALTVLKLKH